jgi:hypothetical protein
MIDILNQILFGTIDGTISSFISGIVGGLGAIGSVASGIMGNQARATANRRAGETIQNAYDLIADVDIPSIQEQMLELERLYLSGQLTPEQEQAVLQRRTELENIVLDPRLREAQMQVLSELDNIVASEGLDPVAQAQVNELRNELSQQERSSREAIIQSANRRGIGGSGLELAAQLANQQGAATRGSQAGFDIAANAQRRALEALQAQGQQAASIRESDYQQAADLAQAQDVINQFNVNQRSDVQRRNIDRANKAQQYNLERQDEQTMFNTNLANQEQMANKGVARQNFLDRQQRAKDLGDILTNQVAPNQQQQGQIKADLYGGISDALSKAAPSAGRFFDNLDIGNSGPNYSDLDGDPRTRGR